MKNTLTRTAILATAATAFALAAGSASAASLKDLKSKGTIRIAVANEIPYGYMDLNGKAKGAGPDVAKHIVHAARHRATSSG